MAIVVEQIRNGARTIHAVSDKLGTPTYTEDLARNLLALVKTPLYGLYHMASEGAGSRFDVARGVLDYYGRDDIELVPVGSDFFAEKYFAPRPRSEVLQNCALERIGLNLMRPWPDALRAYLDQADFITRTPRLDPSPPRRRSPASKRARPG